MAVYLRPAESVHLKEIRGTLEASGSSPLWPTELNASIRRARGRRGSRLDNSADTIAAPFSGELLEVFGRCCEE